MLNNSRPTLISVSNAYVLVYGRPTLSMLTEMNKTARLQLCSLLIRCCLLLLTIDTAKSSLFVRKKKLQIG